MKKRVFSFLLMALAIIVCGFQSYAQEMPQLTPLPDMPGLRTGKLPNGLTYYVLHNEEPKGRANFYIAQKVGSTLEKPDQLGLAHFLEHMAFNGTTHYPGKAMLTYLQNKGIRFGDDINAYTGFDETVYNINNIPVSDQALMDSVLLVLRDWSCDLLLEEDEINAERGVIQEEWRMRNSAQIRRYTAMLPAIFEEYQYRQMPIGTMDVVMNFKPEVLRDYYHSWYRPDQQGIVVVGDFDAAEMEKKVIDMFSTIKMPANVPERTYAEVSDNKEAIYFEFEDPEFSGFLIETYFKEDRVPFEYRNTVEMFINNDLLKIVLTKLINNRLEEYSHDPACAYNAAGCIFENFIVASTKECFKCVVIPKEDAVSAYKDAMSIVARACKTGFTASELERVNTEIIAELERVYNERDKTNSDDRATEIIRHFIENVPAPGAEFEYQMVSTILPQLPVDQINMMANMLLTPENQVIVVSQQKSDSRKLPGKEAMINTLNEVMKADYEPYVDEVITEPLLKKEPVAGKIASEKQGEKFGTTEMTLSNGIKVVVKPTDFSNDEILFQFWREGGMRNYPVAQAPNINLLEGAYDVSRIGNFDAKTLKKYLSGKKLELSIGMGMSTFAFSGVSTVKDFPTLMELLYASMTDVTADQEQYDLIKAQNLRQLDMLVANPSFKFQENLMKTMWNNNPMRSVPTKESIEAADYNAILDLIRNATSNAADFKLVIVGNVDMETLRPLLEKYVASLPSTGKVDAVEVVNPIALPDGNAENIFEVKMQTPQIQVFRAIDGTNLDYNVANDVQISLLGDILGNIYTKTLREEEGGTYSPSAFGQMFPASHQWMLAYSFMTNSDMSQRLQERAAKEALELLNDGADPEMFTQVKEAALNQLNISERNNGFWLSNIQNNERGYDMLTGREEFLKNLTVEKFNAYIKGIYDGKSSINVVMNGVQAE